MGQWITTKIVTLAHRVWVNKKLKDVVKFKLTFAPSLDTTCLDTACPQTNNTQRFAVAGLK